MEWLPFRIFRLGNLKEQHARHVEQMRKMAAHGREVLENNPPPDTFAGRKTQEPFPKSKSKAPRLTPPLASSPCFLAQSACFPKFLVVRRIINLCSGAFRLRGARFDHRWQRHSGVGG
jgi:hypothetical protein